MGPGDDSKKASIADEQTGSADVELAACICATKDVTDSGGEET